MENGLAENLPLVLGTEVLKPTFSKRRSDSLGTKGNYYRMSDLIAYVETEMIVDATGYIINSGETMESLSYTDPFPGSPMLLN